MKIVIALINYYKERDLCEFVKAFLLSQRNVSFQVIVVDNGSESPAAFSSIEHLECLTILRPGKNIGYFGGAFEAFNSCSQNGLEIPEIFVVSNFDLEFDKTNFLNELRVLTEQSTGVVFGPSIRSSLNGAELNPIYKERLTKGHINRLILVTSFYPLFLLYQRLHYMKRRFSGERQSSMLKPERVYAVHGSMMIFKDEFFRKGGTLKFGSFLYGEELFVAEQCRLHNMEIRTLPDLKVVHHEHSTTGMMKDSRHMTWLNESMKFIRERYYE